MPGEEQEFEISFDEMMRLKPIIKNQTEPLTIEGAPPGKWHLHKMVTTFNQEGLKVVATASKVED